MADGVGYDVGWDAVWGFGKMRDGTDCGPGGGTGGVTEDGMGEAMGPEQDGKWVGAGIGNGRGW